jgi:TolB-like protein/DNA-binding winged helix-turn-helix (wHTH) protein/Tfp pilus assembly protein PilF
MAVSAPAGALLRFDNFELDVRSGELRKRGVKLRLQGQPLQVLATLLRRSGELVTRDELRSEIWPADTFVDFDHSLHNAIARIREVLGDSAQKPRFIETLPRRGYRFIADVEVVGIEPEERAPVEEVDATGGSSSWRGKGLATAALMLLGFATIGAALRLAPSILHSKSVTPPRLHSIAVLPLDNLSGDASQEFFVDGMTEELITDLAKVSTLRVISRTSVMRYKGTKKGLPEIAQELNVDAIVEGSVMRSGKRVRITAQLLNAATDQHLWAETYERDLGDVLALQREVAQAIAQQVRAQVTPQQQARLHSAPPVNPEAYEAYLKGRYYLTTQFSKPQELKTAKRYFEESIGKDSSFALAYVGLADAYMYLAIFRQLAPDVAYHSAEDALRKALALDDSIGEAHDTLALLSWRFQRDWENAEHEFSQAITLTPNYSCAHEDHTLFLSLMGRRSQAMAELAKSVELDPGPSSALTESGAYYQLRDFGNLLEASRRGLAANPDEWLEHYYLGVGYEGTGKTREAIAEYEKAIEMSNGDQDAMAALAHAYAAMGRRGEAGRILADVIRKSRTTYVSPYVIATIYAGLGDKNKAFEFLEKALAERCLDVPWFLKADLRIDNLRSDARFQSLWQRAGFSRHTPSTRLNS